MASEFPIPPILPDDLPEGWRIVRLGDVLKEVDLRASDLPEGVSLPVLSLTKERGLVPQEQKFKKRIAKANVANYKVVMPGWIAYNPYVIWEGAIHARTDSTPGLISPAYVTWETTAADPEYLNFAFRTTEFLQRISQLCSGAVNRRRSISKRDFRTVAIVLPPLPEQRAIAGVLRTVRCATERNQQVIVSMREVKRSLIQHLFTFGPVSVREIQRVACQVFENGVVPKHWTIEPLDSVAVLLSGGTPSKGRQEWWEGNIPWLSPKDIKQTRTSDVQDRISAEGLANGSRLAPANTIFVAVRGMALAKDIPITLAEAAMAFNQDVKAVIAGGVMDPDFLLYALLSRKHALMPGVGTSAHGTRRLSSSSLAALGIPVPPLPEQKKIASAMNAVERKLTAEEKKQRALETLFDSLLHSLTTGKLRVHNVRWPPRREEALKILQEHAKELKSDFGVQSLSLFGSVARNEAGPESDVDLLVEFEQPVGMFHFLDLKEHLEALLGAPVDLVTPSALKRQLRDRILEEAVRAA
jgi:type I restriction enzyme S subunit